MLVLDEHSDDALTNLNWLMESPITPLTPSTPPTSPEQLPPSAVFASRCDNVDYRNERVKPPWSYAQLISAAMRSHGGKKVLLTDIYNWIKENFAYYRGNDTSWQNSVRHNLSLNSQFVKVPRDQKDKGKGSYWMLDSNNSANTGKDPYCLRRRNFNEVPTKRVQRPEVSRPQVNPAVRTYLEHARRLQQARRHPFGGAGEFLEDIGAQECVYSDTEPLFDDFNSKLFKKDVEMYNPNSKRRRRSQQQQHQHHQHQHHQQQHQQDTRQTSMLIDQEMDIDLTDVTSGGVGVGVGVGGTLDLGEHAQPKVRVEYNWEAYECQPSGVATGVQLPLEPEIVRLDLRIPTPEWWATNNNSHNLLLSPTSCNPLVKAFESIGGGGGGGGLQTATAGRHHQTTDQSQSEHQLQQLQQQQHHHHHHHHHHHLNRQHQQHQSAGLHQMQQYQQQQQQQQPGLKHTPELSRRLGTVDTKKYFAHPWVDHETTINDSDGLLLDLDYCDTSKLTA